MQDVNRLKYVLVEQEKSSKWLSEQLELLHQLFLCGVLTPLNQTWKRLPEFQSC